MGKIEMTSAAVRQHDVSVEMQARQSQNETRQFAGLGSIVEIRQEIDDALADIRGFYDKEPDEIMRFCSGHTARMTEIRVKCQRYEDQFSSWKRVRTREVEPVIEELKHQFQIASRLLAVRQLDWEIQRGM